MQIQFPLILDGATGTELHKRGFTGDVSAEEWVLAHPEAIADIQRRYVQAGSQVLYCPSFGANRQKLEEHGIFNKTADYNRRLAELSKKAAEGRALIAGDLSPTGLFLAPMGQASFEELVDTKCRAYEELYMAYITPAAREEKLLDYPELFRAPIVRNGKEATVGYKPEIWEKWE